MGTVTPYGTNPLIPDGGVGPVDDAQEEDEDEELPQRPLVQAQAEPERGSITALHRLHNQPRNSFSDSESGTLTPPRSQTPSPDNRSQVLTPRRSRAQPRDNESQLHQMIEQSLREAGLLGDEDHLN